jgi:hypothetical protein
MNKLILLGLCASLHLVTNIGSVSAQTTWNNGFESGTQGWEKPVITPMAGQKPGNNSVEITTKNVRTGKQAIQFEAGSWSPSITMRSELQPLIANADYQQIRLWHLYQGPMHREFGARVQLYDASRAPIKGSLFDRKGSWIPDGDWYPITVYLNVPPEARFYTVELYWATGTGKVAFDDIVLSAIVPPVAVKTGYSLPEYSDAERELWVAGALEKIYPDAVKPQATGKKIQLSAARGESHSVQLVYQPQTPQSTLSVAIDDLKTTSTGKTLPAQAIEVHYVADVEVKGNIQQFGRGGPTPDPLFPTAPSTLPAKKPQSIWLTASVPRDAAAGI